MRPDLLALGWGDELEAALATTDAPGVPCRVVAQHRGQLRVDDGAREGWAHVRGRPTGADAPVIGDWVVAELAEGEDPGVINAILPRHTTFSRRAPGGRTEQQVVAANLDVIFLMSGLDSDFNPNRIERYLVAAWQSGARPVVLLNKADLVEEPADFVDQLADVAIGVDVHLLSAKLGDGIDTVREYLGEGVTIGFVGSSGVGKSTLINQLLGNELLKTQDTRSDDKGRHTTTHRELFRVPGGGLVIDTPGLRELQLWDAQQGIEATFADIEGLADQCKYRDCDHDTEDGCAVLAAIEVGDLSEKRLARYNKLQRELAHLEIAQDNLAKVREKRKWKEIHREMRRFRKKR